MLVNKKALDVYFTQEQDRKAIMSPLEATEQSGRVDVVANVLGGGKTGQAGAVLLGIARALAKMDDGVLGALREGGFLTRDGRMKERKKYGRHGARRGFQFSKR